MLVWTLVCAKGKGTATLNLLLNLVCDNLNIRLTKIVSFFFYTGQLMLTFRIMKSNGGGEEEF